MILPFLAAVSISYAPQSATNYVFTKPPTDICVSGAFGIDYKNARVVFPRAENMTVVGTLRACPITGNPFDGYLRHEGLAWLNEALAERNTVTYEAKSEVATNYLQWGDAMLFGKTKMPTLSSGELAFTNSCITKVPDVSYNVLTYDVEGSFPPPDWVNQCGGNMAAPDIQFVASTNAVRGMPIKMSDLENAVNAVAAFQSGHLKNNSSPIALTDGKHARYSTWDYNYPMVKYANHSQWVEQKSDNDSLSEENVGGGFSRTRSLEISRSKTNYLVDFGSDPDGSGTNIWRRMETAGGGYSNSSVTHNPTESRLAIPIPRYVRVINAGDYNRVTSVVMYHMFRVKEDCKLNNTQLPVVKKIVLVRDEGSVISAKEARQSSAYVPSGVPDDRLLAVPEMNLSSSGTMSAVAQYAGVDFYRTISASTPDEPPSYEELTFREKALDPPASYARANVSSLYQSVSYVGSYVFVDVRFRMK